MNKIISPAYCLTSFGASRNVSTVMNISSCNDNQAAGHTENNVGITPGTLLLVNVSDHHDVLRTASPPASARAYVRARAVSMFLSGR